jgi:hypothetical protein
MDVEAFLAEDRGRSIIVTASVMIALCTLFVGLRFYARYLMSTPLGVQDIVAPFAWLAQMGVSATAISEFSSSFTLHCSY